MSEWLATCQGTVVKGFGRGSKELGIPTANLDESTVEKLPESVKQGIYFGWARVDGDVIRKAVMSVGWNPFYQNTKRSAEIHIMHQFPSDFYGSEIRMLVAGYLRPEKNFPSLDALIEAIHNDISTAAAKLDEPQFKDYAAHPLFSS